MVLLQLLNRLLWPSSFSTGITRLVLILVLSPLLGWFWAVWMWRMFNAKFSTSPRE
jgi:hypothetical protein